MMEFGDRLRTLIEQSGKSQLDFAHDLNMEPSNLSRYVNNNTSPNMDFFNKLLAKKPNVNINWLISGFGDMLDDSLKLDLDTHNVINMVYPVFAEHNKCEDLRNILLNAALEESLISIYSNMEKEKTFWEKWITSNRYEIVFLILLEKVLKLATKNKDFINVTERNAKNTLIKIFKNYSISLSDKAKHFITNNEKKIIISHLESTLTNEDALSILQNMPTVLNKISAHLQKRRKLVKTKKSS